MAAMVRNHCRYTPSAAAKRRYKRLMTRFDFTIAATDGAARTACPRTNRAT